jgi:hypothetical protein
VKFTEPPEFFVVYRHSFGSSRTIVGPAGARWVGADKDLADAAFEFTPRWKWRVGDHSAPMRGWRTYKAAARAADKFAGGVVHRRAEDVVDGEAVDRIVPVAPEQQSAVNDRSQSASNGPATNDDPEDD